MKFGIALPHVQIAADPAAISEWAQGVEALGFDHIRIPNRSLRLRRESRPDRTGLYNVKTPFSETLTTFSFVDDVTSRLEFRNSLHDELFGTAPEP